MAYSEPYKEQSQSNINNQQEYVMEYGYSKKCIFYDIIGSTFSCYRYKISRKKKSHPCYAYALANKTRNPVHKPAMKLRYISISFDAFKAFSTIRIFIYPTNQ